MSTPEFAFLPSPAYIQCRAAAVYAGAATMQPSTALEYNYRFNTFGRGKIAATTKVVPSEGAAAMPAPKTRVVLLRMPDVTKVWDNHSDAQGHYRAEGLELGATYIAVGIDPTGQHKSAGAGPVVATLTGEPAP